MSLRIVVQDFGKVVADQYIFYLLFHIKMKFTRIWKLITITFALHDLFVKRIGQSYEQFNDCYLITH